MPPRMQPSAVLNTPMLWNAVGIAKPLLKFAVSLLRSKPPKPKTHRCNCPVLRRGLPRDSCHLLHRQSQRVNLLKASS